jgi:hypothetical protein
MFHRDTLIFIVEAMGINTNIHSDMDELYRTNESAFSECARKSPLYGHSLVVGGTTRHEEYAKKALGMMLHTIESRDKQASGSIDRMIQKGWPRAFEHILNHHRKADVQRYIASLKNAHSQSAAENSAELFIFYSLCIRHKLKIIEMKEIMNFFLMLSFRNYLHGNERHYNFYGKLDGAARKEADELKSRVFRDYGIVVTPDNQIHTKDAKLAKLHRFFYRLAFSDKIELYYLFKELDVGEREIRDVFSAYLDELVGGGGGSGDGNGGDGGSGGDGNSGGSSSSSSNSSSTSDSGDSTFANDGSSDSEAAALFISGLIVKLLVKSVIQAKEYYFLHTDGQLREDADRQAKEIAGLGVENARLVDENARLKEMVAGLTEKLHVAGREAEKPHLEQIRALEKQLARQNESMQQEREKERELVALRDFFFSVESREAEQDAGQGASPQAIMDLTHTAGAIIGGNPRWSGHMKELLPKWVFISSEGFDKRSLDGIQTICFLPNHMSHALYYKAIGIAKAKNMDIGFIYSQNEQLALNEIARVLAKASS